MTGKKGAHLSIRIPDYQLELIDKLVRESNGTMDRSDVVRQVFDFFFVMTRLGLHQVFKPLEELKDQLIELENNEKDIKKKKG